MESHLLRKKILELVFSGKLIKNDHESYYFELSNILCDKEKAILSGKIPKPKKNKHIFDNSILYDIPNNWRWSKLDDITYLIGDGLHGTPDYDKNGDYYFINGNNLSERKIIIKADTKKCSTDVAKKHLKNLNKDTILISINGTLGNMAFYNNEKVILGKSACYLNLHSSINKDYIYYFLQTDFVKKYMNDNSTGTTIKNVSLDAMRNLPVPIPSIEIQNKICELLKHVDVLIKSLEFSYNKISLEKDKLKKVLFDMAIHGKIVSNDNNLEKINLNSIKENYLIENGLKKDKKVKDVDLNEVPYSIPSNWIWARLGDLGVYKKGPFGSSLTKSMFVDDGENSVKVYEQQNAIKKDWKLGTYYISKEKFESMKCFEVKPNDIIVSCAGTIGEVYVVPTEARKGIINQALMKISLFDNKYRDFFILYFDYVLKKEANDKGKGTAMKNIPPFDILKNMYIPLPPYEEQEKIINRVDVLIDLIDQI